jgi:group I intron endonuclease
MSRHKKDAERGTTKTYLGNAIRKYGWENFTKEIICKAINQEDLDKKEIELIHSMNTKYPNGYNIKNGGFGGGNGGNAWNRNLSNDKTHILAANARSFVTEESLKKMSETIKNSFRSGERIHPRKGKHLSVESIAKIVEKKSSIIVLVNPNGDMVIIKNVKKFAKENNLTPSNLRRVFSGERKSHKGWTKYMNNRENI